MAGMWLRGLGGWRPAHLLPRGDGQDEGGEHRQGVLGAGGPALDLGPHGQTEEGHGLGQREGLVVILRVAEDET